MASSELAMLLGSVESNLGFTYQLEGETHPLTEFTGVVMKAENGESEYYEWEVVDLEDDLGIQLSSPSGRVHIHAISYFTRQLESGDYVPAVYDRDTDQLHVATAYRDGRM